MNQGHEMESGEGLEAEDQAVEDDQDQVQEEEEPVNILDHYYADYLQNPDEPMELGGEVVIEDQAVGNDEDQSEGEGEGSAVGDNEDQADGESEDSSDSFNRYDADPSEDEDQNSGEDQAQNSGEDQDQNSGEDQDQNSGEDEEQDQGEDDEQDPDEDEVQQRDPMDPHEGDEPNCEMICGYKQGCGYRHGVVFRPETATTPAAIPEVVRTDILVHVKYLSPGDLAPPCEAMMEAEERLKFAHAGIRYRKPSDNDTVDFTMSNPREFSRFRRLSRRLFPEPRNPDPPVEDDDQHNQGIGAGEDLVMQQEDQRNDDGNLQGAGGQEPVPQNVEEVHVWGNQNFGVNEDLFHQAINMHEQELAVDPHQQLAQDQNKGNNPPNQNLENNQNPINNQDNNQVPANIQNLDNNQNNDNNLNQDNNQHQEDVPNQNNNQNNNNHIANQQQQQLDAHVREWRRQQRLERRRAYRTSPLLGRNLPQRYLINAIRAYCSVVLFRKLRRRNLLDFVEDQLRLDIDAATVKCLRRNVQLIEDQAAIHHQVMHVPQQNPQPPQNPQLPRPTRRARSLPLDNVIPPPRRRRLNPQNIPPNADNAPPNAENAPPNPGNAPPDPENAPPNDENDPQFDQDHPPVDQNND